MNRLKCATTALAATGCLLLSSCGHSGSANETSAGPAVATTSAAPAGSDQDNEYLEIDPAKFHRSTDITSEWWPLKPGHRLTYDGYSVEDGEEVPHTIVDTVTDLTKVIYGIRAVVSLEEDYSDGQLVERELAFHAQDDEGNVWHLGQLREEYEDGSTFIGAQSWLVGHLNGAKAGIRMMAKPRVGTTYSQGFAPAPFSWTDRSRVVQMGQKTTVRAGSFDDVLLVEEWDQETPRGVFQLKYYARGVGVVRVGYKGPDPEKEEVELVRVEQLNAEELAEARDVALKIEERAYVYGSTPPAQQNSSSVAE
jgi:hypothetical protein